MKKLMMRLGLVVLAVSAVNVFAVSTGEWQKWQSNITIHGNYREKELCMIKDYLSNYPRALNEYIYDLEKLSTSNATKVESLNKLLSFFASLRNKEKEKFKKEIIIPQITKINPNASCL